MSNLLSSQGMPRPSPLHRHGGRIAASNGMLPISIAADSYSVAPGGTIREMPAWPPNVPVTVRFEGATTLVNSAKLAVQGGANYTTGAGDMVLFVPLGSAGWQVYLLSAAGQLLSLPFSLKADGRLTLVSGDPVPAADQLAKGTIFYTPYCGNVISLYDGAKWVNRAFSEISLALTATSGKPYDVFVYDNAGVAALETLVWTDDTTRATALVRQDGVWCKTGALTRRYVGTFYASASNQCEDSRKKRLVWNMYNRARRGCRSPLETVATWTYTTQIVRQANANAANQFDFVRGLDEDSVDAYLSSAGSSSTALVILRTGIGLDATNAFATDCTPGIWRVPAVNSYGNVVATYSGMPGIGRHFLAWLEFSEATGTTTWQGDGGEPSIRQMGMRGSVLA